MKEMKDYIQEIPDFPKPGILFRDLTSVLQDPEGLHRAVDELQARVADCDFDVLVGAESRGFLLGMPLAYNLGKAFVPVRKAGKLPRETVSADYALEYGTATVEMHRDAIRPGQRVVLLDDLLATGGTMEACVRLVESLGGVVVKIVFLMELTGLNGRAGLDGYEVDSVVVYEGA